MPLLCAPLRGVFVGGIGREFGGCMNQNFHICKGNTTEKYYIEQGDCLELMKDIPDGCIDLILCDLPYGTTDCKWDTVIPFEPLWSEYERIVKPTGTVALFGSEPFSTKLRMSNFDKFKYDWIWLKNNSTGFQHAKNMPLKNYEIISVFSYGSMGHANLLGGRRMTYNPQGLKPCERFHNGKRGFGGIVGKRPSHRDVVKQEFTNYPKMVLKFDNEFGLHPTQKPVALLEYLIKTYTNSGEVVLDNCMGSGSTGVACVNTGRRFIGMELDNKYFEVAKQRINDAVLNAGCTEQAALHS